MDRKDLVGFVFSKHAEASGDVAWADARGVESGINPSNPNVCAARSWGSRKCGKEIQYDKVRINAGEVVLQDKLMSLSQVMISLWEDSELDSFFDEGGKILNVVFRVTGCCPVHGLRNLQNVFLVSLKFGDGTVFSREFVLSSEDV